MIGDIGKRVADYGEDRAAGEPGLRLLHKSEDDRFPILPTWSVRQVMPDTGIIALDNGVCNALATIWERVCPQRWSPGSVARGRR